MHYEIDYRYLAELLIYIFSFLSSSHGPSHLSHLINRLKLMRKNLLLSLRQPLTDLNLYYLYLYINR